MLEDIGSQEQKYVPQSQWGSLLCYGWSNWTTEGWWRGSGGARSFDGSRVVDDDARDLAFLQFNAMHFLVEKSQLDTLKEEELVRGADVTKRWLEWRIPTPEFYHSVPQVKRLHHTSTVQCETHSWGVLIAVGMFSLVYYMIVLHAATAHSVITKAVSDVPVLLQKLFLE